MTNRTPQRTLTPLELAIAWEAARLELLAQFLSVPVAMHSAAHRTLIRALRGDDTMPLLTTLYAGQR